jgi:hypothetical protein
VETAGDRFEALKKLQWMEWVDLVALDYLLPGQIVCVVLKEFKLRDNRDSVLVASDFFYPRVWPALKKRGPCILA